MKIQDIMRKKFLFFEESTPLSKVVAAFAKEGVWEAPVLRRGKLLGMISDKQIAEHSLKSGFLDLWKKAELENAVKIRGIPAIRLAKRRPFTLSEHALIADAILIISRRNDDMIPVLGKDKTVVGVVRGQDIVITIAKQLATQEIREKKGAHETKTPEFEGRIQTAVDFLLEMVGKRALVKSRDAAKSLNLTERALEDIARILEKHNLIEMDYDLTGRFTMRAVK